MVKTTIRGPCPDYTAPAPKPPTRIKPDRKPNGESRARLLGVLSVFKDMAVPRIAEALNINRERVAVLLWELFHEGLVTRKLGVSKGGQKAYYYSLKESS